LAESCLGMVAGSGQERFVCRSDTLKERGRGFCFEVPGLGTPAPAFVIRYDGRVHAYLNQCAHTPVRMDSQPGEFFDHSRLYLVCAIHGALYAPESGHCLGGRCNGNSLRRLEVVERDGAVYLL
jgi:nitrite reductase/ring-hydroxylating ferredoxin subunit